MPKYLFFLQMPGISYSTLYISIYPIYLQGTVSKQSYLLYSSLAEK